MVADEHHEHEEHDGRHAELEQQMLDRPLDEPPAGMRERLLTAMRAARDDESVAGDGHDTGGASDPEVAPPSPRQLWRAPAGLAATVLLGLHMALLAGLARGTDPSGDAPRLATDARLRDLVESRDPDVVRIARQLRPRAAHSAPAPASASGTNSEPDSDPNS